MPDTIHKKIVDNIKSELAGITQANGFNSNIGNNVFHWLTSPIETNDLPCCNVFDSEVDYEDYGQGGIGAHECTLEVVIETYAEDATGRDSLHGQVDDIVKKLGEDSTRGGNAIRTRLTNSSMGSKINEKWVDQASVTISIDFLLNEFDLTT